MKRLVVVVLAVCFAVMGCIFALAGGGEVAVDPVVEPGVAKKHLRAFASESELKSFFKKIRKKRRSTGYGYGSGAGEASSAPVATANTATVSLDGVSDGFSVKESITNTQMAGVDEGGIVKMYGDYLVVLRRGRLFTVSIANNSLKPVSQIDAFGPDIDPEGTWYDEMLISDNNVVVIGYSYGRGGTELGLFRIDRDGGLKYRATYHMRANDYYSSRNYASRLIGNKLIFYSPLYIDPSNDDPFAAFPAVRKWHKGAKPSEFKRIITADRIYRPEQGVEGDDELALHTVTTCDLLTPDMSCDATAVMGPPGNVFYVSSKAVYVWATRWNYENEKQTANSILFRQPLDRVEPSAIRVSGGPVDQFSFLEDESNGLNVLVRSESKGDGMWTAEVSEGDTALLRITDDMFADGSTFAPMSSYRQLHRLLGYSFQNRFVGDYLLYGMGNSWGDSGKSKANDLYLVNWRTGERNTIPLDHSVDRLDALASDGIVVGTKGSDLYFTSIKLDRMPRAVDSYSIKNASQGETRSQGFFYKPDNDGSGVLGLPISSGGRAGYEQLREGSAAVIFLRNDSLRFSELGRLRSALVSGGNDDCKASCVDWYGNARPIFARGRVFALLGYEIVEGKLTSDNIAELRRVDFSPSVRSALR